MYKRNVNDINWVEMQHGQLFQNERKMLTPLHEAYIPKVGCSIYRLKPGKRAFPLHEHLANDEAILITRGVGMLQYGEEEIALIEGDYIHLPAASGRAHHMINSGETDLEYLCISSMLSPEIVKYPESNKLGAMSYVAPAEGEARSRMVTFLRHEPVEYWDGEADE